MKKQLIIFLLLSLPSAAIADQPVLPEPVIHQARGFGNSIEISLARVEICKEILRITETTETSDVIVQISDWMVKNFFSENAQRETMQVCGIYLRGVIDGRESVEDVVTD